MKFTSVAVSPLTAISTELLVVTVQGKHYNDALSCSELDSLLAELDASNDFSGKNKQSLLLIKPTGFNCKRLLLIGAGSNPLSQKAGFELAALMAEKSQAIKASDCTLVIANRLDESTDEKQLFSDIASQFLQSSYRYTKTLSKPQEASKLESVLVAENGFDSANLSDGITAGNALGLGLSLTRELGNLPANYCTPTDLQTTAETLAADCAELSVNTLEEADMKELGMGSLLSVAAGSVQPAKLICLEYNGGTVGEAPVALVGKGVTFDTGGISLKPGAKMDEMKYDMCGAATVMGIFKALTVLKPGINVVGIIPATENMPAGNATKPGDVVTSMAGKTIEVLNTDAEGRLILCDALTYAGKYQPKAVIDIATLTGACIVALGHHRTAVYSNDDSLRNQLFNSGENTQDLCWQMPLDEAYTKQLKSKFADLGNIGGPAAGSVTAACFLAEFTKDYNWAHLDIAGSAWNSPGIKGASGRPVSFLFNYLLNQ